MRKFSLILPDGRALDLQGGNCDIGDLSGRLYFANVQGMGADIDATYATTSPGFFTLSAQRPKQISLAGDLVIAKKLGAASPYELYQIFANNCVGQPITVRYKPLEKLSFTTIGAYDLDGCITKITKPELRRGDLVCGIEIKAHTPWYVRTYASLRTTGSSIQFANHVTRPGTLDAAICFTATLSAESSAGFSVALMDGDVTIARATVDAAIASGSVVVWDTRPNRQRFLIDGADATSMLNLNDSSFALIPSSTEQKEYSIVTTNLTGSKSMELYEYWRTV